MIYSYVIPAGGCALNGNIMAHSDSVMGDWAFMYDTLNRLTVGAAAANPGTPYPNTMSCWAYDSKPGDRRDVPHILKWRVGHPPARMNKT